MSETMSKTFKVGDQVRCVVQQYGMPWGWPFTVVEVLDERFNGAGMLRVRDDITKQTRLCVPEDVEMAP